MYGGRARGKEKERDNGFPGKEEQFLKPYRLHIGLAAAVSKKKPSILLHVRMCRSVLLHYQSFFLSPSIFGRESQHKIAAAFSNINYPPQRTSISHSASIGDNFSKVGQFQWTTYFFEPIHFQTTGPCRLQRYFPAQPYFSSSKKEKTPSLLLHALFMLINFFGKGSTYHI